MPELLFATAYNGLEITKFSLSNQEGLADVQYE